MVCILLYFCWIIDLSSYLAVKSISSQPIGIMSATSLYHCAALLSTRVLSSLVARGDTYHAIQWILFQAHSSLLQMALESAQKTDEKQITLHCDNLSALIKNSTIPPGKQLLELQEKVKVICWF